MRLFSFSILPHTIYYLIALFIFIQCDTKGNIEAYYEEEDYEDTFLSEEESDSIEDTDIPWGLMVKNYTIGVFSGLIVKIIFYFLAQRNKVTSWEQIVLIFSVNFLVCIVILLATKYELFHTYGPICYYMVLVLLNSLLSYFHLASILNNRGMQNLIVISSLAKLPRLISIIIVCLAHSIIILLLEGIYYSGMKINEVVLPKIEEISFYLEEAFYEREKLKKFMLNQFIRNILSCTILTALLLVLNQKDRVKIYAGKTFFILNMVGYILVAITFILLVEFGINKAFDIEETPQWVYLFVLEMLQSILFTFCSSMFKNDVNGFFLGLIGVIFIFCITNFILQTFCDMLGILITKEEKYSDEEPLVAWEEWEEDFFY